MEKYYIEEKEGKFYPCILRTRKDCFWSKPEEYYARIMIAPFTEASFKTLAEAEDFIRLKQKPIIYHEFRG